MAAAPLKTMHEMVIPDEAALADGAVDEAKALESLDESGVVPVVHSGGCKQLDTCAPAEPCGPKRSSRPDHAAPKEDSPGAAGPQAQAQRREQNLSRTVDVLDNLWKTRPDRDIAHAQHPIAESRVSLVRKLFSHLFADISFAFGSFRGGGFVGPPHSIYQIYNDFLEILPTQSPSEGFERACSDGADVKLDSSLQLISKRMKEILKGIEGRARMSAVRFLGWVLGKLWGVLFTSVEVNIDGVERVRSELASAARSGKSVMLLPTHRSHIDYLLMSYICFGFNLPVPHIASGQNLNIPVIGTLFAYSGAFFLRRSFRGDNLYKKVLYGYLLRKLREGSLIECFVEGGRSRTGMISEPKLGIILTAVRFVRDGSLEDVVLLPASIDYERTVETASHVDQLLGKKKKSESLLGAVSSGAQLLSGSTPHGGVHVNFAEGVSVRKVIQEIEDRQRRPGDNVGADLYIPEEVCVNAVAQAVVERQRQVSHVSATALAGAALLGACSAADFEVEALAGSLAGLLELVSAAGANTLSVADLRSGAFDAAASVRRSFQVLQPLLDLPKGASSTAARVSNDYIDAVAKQRLRVRYQCGQLVPVLAPHAVVATALRSMANGAAPDQFFKREAVLRSAVAIGEMVRHGVPGAALTQAGYRCALDNLAQIGAVDVGHEGQAVRAAASGTAVLRCLRILVAPSINACCACLSAVASLSQGGKPIRRDELVNHTRDVVYAMFRGEATDWAKQLAVAPTIAEDQAGLGAVVGFPESLSSLEIRGAIKGLLGMGVFGSYSQSGFIGVSPTHSPNSSLSAPSSQMSLISVASSKTFVSSASSEADASEKKSLGSTSETQSAAADQAAQQTLELSPSYVKGQGIKLLEKLSSLQRHLYRDERPTFELPRTLPSGSAPAESSRSSWPAKPSWSAFGAALVLSGALLPLVRTWRKSMTMVASA